MPRMNDVGTVAQIAQALNSTSGFWCGQLGLNNEKQCTDLGLGGFQLAQLQAGKGLVRQGLDDGHKAVQIRHWLPVQLCEPVQSIQVVAVRWAAVMPSGDVHSCLLRSKAQLPDWPVRSLQHNPIELQTYHSALMISALSWIELGASTRRCISTAFYVSRQ